MEAIKIDDNTIEVTREELVTKKVTYDIYFLLKQRVEIQKSLHDFTVARKAELAEVDELLAQCEAMGIKVASMEVELE